MSDYEYQYPDPDSPDYYHYSSEEPIDIIGKVYSYFENFNLLLQFLVIFVNIFHLLFLLQKDVRSSSIYILMIGICVSDLLNFIISVYMEGVDRKWYYRIYDFSNIDCLREDYVVINIGYEVLKMFINSTRPISVWLAITMALVRVIFLVFPLKPWITKLASFKITVILISTISLFWSAYYSWSLVFLASLWYPDNLCDNQEVRQYSINVSVFVTALPISIKELSAKQEDWEHWVRIVPTIFYPILSIRLLMKLREINKQRRRASDVNQEKTGKSDNLTKLILFVTISFMLSEGTDGVRSFLLIDLFYWGVAFPRLRRSLLSSQYIITSLRCFNSMSHILVCYFMSSQYRGAVHSMCCVTKRPVVKVIPVRSSSSQASRSTSSQKKKTKTLNYELY